MDSKSPSGSSLRSNSALLFCRMCQAVYRQPKLLPCLHSFCRPCLVDIVTNGEDGNVVVCPLCSHITKVPPDGVADIPDNCFLGRMCQEYISEVQSHIVARSLHPTTSRRSSEFAELRSQLTEELSHRKGSPPPRPLAQHDSQLVPEESDRAPTQAHASVTSQSTAKAMETIHNMGRLQTKIMSLQGEALRVTYAIDQVNQCMIEWHQHKDDVKRAVQRRSAQFQFFVKRMEHQLISQIEGKHADDEFYAESDKSKTELRKVLKKILHEVNVLKTIQELGNDAEVNTLSFDLLGKSVGMTDVFLNKLQFNMDVPTQSMEEIVADWFGVVRLSSVAANVFAPEVLDFTEITMENFTEQNGHGFSPYEEDKSALGDEEFDSSGEQKNSNRSFSDSSVVRYNDEDLDKEDVREHLVQFQSARETLRTKRREILALGQQAREGVSSLRDESHRRPRSALRRDRVQSLDRKTTPVSKKSNKTGLSVKSGVNETAAEHEKKLQHEHGLVAHPELVFNLQHVTGGSHFFHRSIPEDIHVPSPVIEEVSLLHTPQRILVKQTSDPRSVISALKEMPGAEAKTPSHSQSATDHLSTNASSGSGDPFRGRRHSSDHFASISSGRGSHVDVTHDKNATRLARRAISGVADRKTKIDYLRENWQKRKEILIQNEGFVSPDSMAKHTARSSVHPWSPTIYGSSASFDTSQLEDNMNDSFGDHNQEMIAEVSSGNRDTTSGKEQYKDGIETSSLQSRSSNSPKHFNDSSRNPEDTSQMPLSSHYCVTQAQSTMTGQHLRTTPQSSAKSTPNSTQTSSSTSATEQLLASLAQEETDIINSHNTSSSDRYSRFSPKPTETIDTSSFTAAIYSVRQKPIAVEPIQATSLNSDTTMSGSTHTAGNASTETSHKPPQITSPSSRHHFDYPAHTKTEATAQPGSLESQPPLKYPYTGTSPHIEAIGRRHTISMGSAAIQDAVHLKDQESSKGRDTTLWPLAESTTDEDRIKYAYMRYKMRENASNRVPSPIHLIQEHTPSDQSATSSDSPAVLSTSATSLASPQPPSSPTLSDGVQRVKLRELTRKKKERWRHLTIH